MILCDAGVLLCLVDRTQLQHNAYKSEIRRLSKPLITTWSCLTEAMYLALHRGGWPMQNQVGQLLLDKLLMVYQIQEDDYSRLLALMAQYQDRPMDRQMRLWFWWLKRQNIAKFSPSILISCFTGLTIEIALMSFKFSDKMYV